MMVAWVRVAGIRGGWETNQNSWHRKRVFLAEFRFGASSSLLSTISTIPLFHTTSILASIHIIPRFSSPANIPHFYGLNKLLHINHNVFSSAFDALESRFDTSR